MIPLQRMQPLLGLALGGLLVAGCASSDVRNFKDSGAYARNCPSANPNDGTPDDIALQSCLNGGGTVTLDAGNPGYIIATGLTITVNGTILTSSDPNNRALVIAHANLNAPLLKASGALSNYRVDSVRFDGNKANRTATCLIEVGARLNCTNLEFRGDGFVINNIESSHNLAGSALGVLASNFEIKNSQFYSNGYLIGERGGDPWSDGMTLAYCQNGNIHDNHVEDSTDIAIVLGGTNGYGCRVEHNTIVQTNTHAFAGLAIHNFGNVTDRTSGNHTKSFYRYNTITSGLNKMDLGISVGMKGWFPDIDTYGGSIINNSVSGAAINLDIYGYHDGTVNNNTLSNPQGSFAGIGANYAAAVVENVCMQPGWVVRAVNIVEVSTWDTGEVLASTCRGGSGTQSLLPGATPSSFSVPAGWQVYHAQEFESSTLTLSSP